MSIRSRFWPVGRAVAAGAFLAGALFVAAGPASASTPLNGGGSGFAGLEIQQWQADVDTPAHGNLIVDYSSQSSGIGRQYFASNTWDYGASDIRYIPGIESVLENQLQSGRCGGRQLPNCFKYVPVSAGGLGFMYNLATASGSRATHLELTPSDVCGIFTGRITSWGQLASNNQFLTGSTQPITPVVRQDEAGESYVLSEYCIAEDPGDWGNFVKFQQTASCTNGLDYTSIDGSAFNSNPPQPIPVWPSVLLGCRNVPTASGSEGVADTVHDPTQGPGSITYDAAGYAIVRQLPNAYVQNAAGVFTLPGATSVTVALEYASPVGDGTFSLDFNEKSGADVRAYNPSTYSYVLAQTGGFDTGRGSTLGRFLCYAIGAGQVRASALLYAPLSAAVQAIGEAAIVQIPGAPNAAQCLQGAPPAPPPPPLQKVKPVVKPVTTVPSTPGVTSSGAASSGAPTSPTAGGSASVGVKAGSASAGTGCSSVATTSVAPSDSSTTSSTAVPSVGGSASTSTSTSTTTTLVPCSNTAGGNASAATPGPANLQDIATASHGITNYDAMSSLFEGGVVCAVGVALAGRRRKNSG